MLKKLLTPFTSPTVGGVITRYGAAMFGMLLTVAGAFNWLDQSQIDALKNVIPDLLKAFEGFWVAVGLLISSGTVVYATITHSASVKADMTAKAVDATPSLEGEKIEIKTPGSEPNIVIPANPK